MMTDPSPDLSTAQLPLARFSPDSQSARESVFNLPVLWPNIVRSVVEGERAYEVLARRFRLDGRERLALGDLGHLLGISRERVRQIEGASLKKLRALFDGDHFLGGTDQPNGDAQGLYPALQSEVAALLQRLQSIGFPLAEAELWDIVEERYGAAPTASESPFLALLLVVLGLVPLRATPPEVVNSLPLLWLDNAADKTPLVTMVNTAQWLLTHTATAIALPDLLTEVNAALLPMGRETDSASLRRLLSLCPDVEAVGEEMYQARFGDLSTIVLRLERILRGLAAQGKLAVSSQEVTEEFNRCLALEGLPGNISLRSVSGALGRTPALTTIGKSGGWTLKENAGETRPIFEIMEEALQVLNRPASPGEIARYVLSRRGASSNTVPGLLSQHLRFQRVGPGLYGLRSWGLEEGPVSKRGEEHQMEFDSALESIFLGNDGKPLRLAVLVAKLCQMLGWVEVSVRRRLENSPRLDFTSLGNRRLLVHWRDVPKAGNTPKNPGKRGQVQTAARRLLRAAPEGQMAGRVLSALLERETGFVRPLIYNSLANMSDVERLGDPRNLTYKLVNPETSP